MGACATKPKKKIIEQDENDEDNKENHGKQQQHAKENGNSKESDVKHGELKDGANPAVAQEKQDESLDGRLVYLCSDKFNEQLKGKTVEFSKVLSHSSQVGFEQLELSDFERVTKTIRDKLQTHAESVSELAGARASACEALIAHFERRLPPSAVARFQTNNAPQEKNNTNNNILGNQNINSQNKKILSHQEVKLVVWEVYSIAVKCLQVVLTLRLTPFNQPLQPWWNHAEANPLDNVCAGLTAELDELSAKINGQPIKNKGNQPPPVVIGIGGKPQNDKTTNSNGINVHNATDNKNSTQKDKENEDVAKVVAHDYVSNLFSNIDELQENKKDQEQEINRAAAAAVAALNGNKPNGNHSSQVLIDSVEIYLPSLYKKVLDFIDFEDSYGLEQGEVKHGAAACSHYSIDASLKKAITLHAQKKD